MKNTKTKSQMETLKLAEAFEVEELEERVEFGKWTTDIQAGATCGGGNCDGYVKKAEFTYTMKAPW